MAIVTIHHLKRCVSQDFLKKGLLRQANVVRIAVDLRSERIHCFTTVFVRPVKSFSVSSVLS